MDEGFQHYRQIADRDALCPLNRLIGLGGHVMSAMLESYRITRFRLPLRRIIGDSQVRFEKMFFAALELRTQSGQVGLGLLNAFSLPPQAELERLFAAEDWPGLQGQSIYPLLTHLTRPRGGNIRSHLFDEALNQALWDLYGKEVSLPLYRLLGGTNNRVRAYASGLDFHLTSTQLNDFYTDAVKKGYSAFKVKVGHPDLAWDIALKGRKTSSRGNLVEYFP